MSAERKSPEILHADPEHGGLRFVVILVLIISLVVGFFLVHFLLNLLASGTTIVEFALVVSCAITIPLALGFAWLVEAILKRKWHSGKYLNLRDDTLAYIYPKTDNQPPENGANQISFDWSKRVNVLYWYFRLKGYPRAGRERRVSDNWLCLASQLQQDAELITVFSYLAPEQAAAWIKNNSLSEPFMIISLAEVYKPAGKKKRQSASIRPTIDASLLTSAEGRYWLAEQKRWQQGIELTKEDFNIFISYVEDKNNSIQ